MAVGDPQNHAPSWDYGSWETDKYGYGGVHPRYQPRVSDPTNAEREILFRLERLEQMLSMMYRFVENQDAEKKFLRIRCAELERLKASDVPGSLPESSQVPLA